MIKLKGVLVDGSNLPVADARILLRSVKNGSVPDGIIAEVVTDKNGAYDFSANVGSYLCYIYAENKETALPGYVNIYSYSGEGTLQEYLYAPCEMDARPMFIFMWELARREIRAAQDDINKKHEEIKVIFGDIEGKYDANTYYITSSDKDGTTAGLAGTDEGGMFRVAQGVSADNSFIYYRKVDGKAVKVALMPSSVFVEKTSQRTEMNESQISEIKKGYKQITADSSDVPLFVDESGKVPVWLKNGMLGASGIEQTLAKSAIDRSGVFPDYTMGSDMVALHVDEGRKVPLWLEGGKLGAAGVTKEFATMVANEIGIITDREYRFTDGRSLFHLRTKISKMMTSGGRVNIITIGDSWSAFRELYNAISAKVQAMWKPLAGTGWIQLETESNTVMTGIKITRTGFTEFKANGTAPYGSGVDGIAYYATAPASATIEGISDTNGRIFYYDTTGTINLKVGSNTQTVNGGGTNSYKSANITILTSGSDKLEVSTTGTVCIHGFDFWKSEDGPIIYKCGCGGSWAGQHIEYMVPRVKDFAQAIKPDLVIINLGTNDYIQNRPTTTYRQALSETISAWRKELPNACFMMISPPACNTAERTPMIDYRNTMKNVAEVSLVEWYDLFGDSPKSWVEGSAAGWWKDNYHPSDAGANQIANTTFNKIINS